MTSRIRFFNNTGGLLGDYTDIPTTPRSWVLNGYGRCEFTVSLDHPACNEMMLRFGNFIHIEHIPSADGLGKLPDWTGIILPPRTWNTKNISVVAYSMEALLAYRAMPFISVSGTPDSVFKQIIELTYKNITGPIIRFEYDKIYDGLPDTYSDVLRTNAYDHIQKLIKSTGLEWNIRGWYQDGASKNALKFVISLKLPNKLSVGTLTATNTEQQDPLLTEQGTIINQIFGYSQAYTDADRVTQEADDYASQKLYGVFQLNQVYIGKTTVDDVLHSANSQLLQSGPRKLFKRVALDKDSIFNWCGVGNVLSVEDTRVGFNPSGGFGFNSLVHVVTVEYNDTSNKAPLNVEIIEPLLDGEGRIINI